MHLKISSANWRAFFVPASMCEFANELVLLNAVAMNDNNIWQKEPIMGIRAEQSSPKWVCNPEITSDTERVIYVEYKLTLTYISMYRSHFVSKY